jgi:hydrogen peroxide-dependent heme synthase
MENQPRFEYTAFWLFERRDDWRQQVHGAWDSAVEEFAGILDAPEEGVTVRGVYSTIGLRPDVDLIIWVHAPKLDQLSALAVKLDQTAIGRGLRRAQGYIGAAGMSQYDPTHGPAFLKGIESKRYLSVYPFTKTPDWFLLDFQERRRLMLEHGEMGREFPDILTNTVNSFGVQDQEFIVALEDDDPNQIIKMVQKLRGAEVRKWTALDTPIFLGEKKATREVLADIRG